MLGKLKETKLLSKVNTFSSWMWLASVITFSVSIFAMIAGWFGNEPCLWLPACGDVPTFAFTILALFVGFLFFPLMLVSGLARRILKAKKYTPPIGLTATKASLATILILALSLGYFIILGEEYQGTSPEFDGQHLFNAVNIHRKEKGVKEVEQDISLCNNLVARWEILQKEETVGHDGFSEWAEENVYKLEPEKYQGGIGELYVGGVKTTAGAITFWEESPGHSLSLKDPRWDVGCSYASNGFGVFIFGDLDSAK